MIIINKTQLDNVSSYVRKLSDRVKAGHKKQDETGKEFLKYIESVFETPIVQSMKEFNHHSSTSCLQHSVHVAYYNYIISKKLKLDTWAASKAGMLHDLFLYDWHTYKPKKGERLHGFEHPRKALENAKKHFNLTPKEEDIIKKHMFPLTLTPPKYKETVLIILTDKFCSSCEVLDRFFKKKRRDRVHGRR